MGRESGQDALRVDGRAVELSNPDKVLFPDAGIRKRDLCAYYARIAATLLPHVTGRIVSMQRMPDGIDGKRFFQKDVPDHFPEWIRTVRVRKQGGSLNQVVIDDAATLVYLANQACITPHVWLSRAEQRRRPDRLVFDLDPSGSADFDDVRWAARRVRDVLEDLDVTPFVMTTGSRGLHVVVPLDGAAGFEEARALAHDVARVLVERHPMRLTLEQRKAKRGDRIYLDVLRNAYAQTTVAPYAVRALPEAPVATPIDWHELGRVGPRRYTIENLFRRLSQKADPWKAMGRSAVGVREVRERLDRR